MAIPGYDQTGALRSATACQKSSSVKPLPLSNASA
jgi:hypothetical protein